MHVHMCGGYVYVFVCVWMCACTCMQVFVHVCNVCVSDESLSLPEQQKGLQSFVNTMK